MLSPLCLLRFSFKSYNVCVVKPSYDYCTLQLCQTAAQHSKSSFHVGGTSLTLKESEVELDGTILLV